MKGNLWKRRVAMGLAAGMLAFGGSFAVQPAPAADAGWGDVIGAVVGGFKAKAEAEKQIKELDQTEQGRQELLTMFQEEYGVEENSPWESLCARAIDRVSAGIAKSDPSVHQKPFLWFINQQDSFNAFCSLGHVMSINRGLFYYLQNEDEIAVVFGHEMGHGMKSHVADSWRKKIDVAIGAQVLAGMTNASEARNIVLSTVVKQINQVSIGRAHEWEADGLALKYITDAGYNPGAAAAVWQRFMEQQGNNPQNFASEMFNPSDHPTNKERRDKYMQSVKEYSGGNVEVKDGAVYVKGKKFVAPAATESMSSAERAYFVQGNLAAAYHNGHAKEEAYVDGNIVMLGAQPVMSCLRGDESAAALVDKLNQMK